MRKKLLWLTVCLTAVLLSLLIIFYPSKTNEKQIPSLLSHPMHFDSALIERAWKDIAAQGDLTRIFYRDRGNRYFPVQEINCRVKYLGVSRQALLAPAGSRLELELKAEEGDQLTFSIFNPLPTIMRFLVKAGSPGRETLLFRRSLSKRINKVEMVVLPKTGKKTVRLILETQGSGVGAWIDPCQLHSHSRPRTVLILMLDTMRADHVSAYGYRRLTTPVLDELAKGSLLFSRAFSTSSWTLPAHVSLFSGLNVLEHGVVSPQSSIPLDIPLLAEMMQKSGFITLALTGGGFVDDHYGFYRGFQMYANSPTDVFRKDAAELLGRYFLKKVAGFPDQDLFIFLHTYQMHSPYKVPDSYRKVFNPDLDEKTKSIDRLLHMPNELFSPLPVIERQKLIDLYDASIFYSDQELLKPILAYLHKSNRFDDAMLIVLSDHGEEFYDHGSWKHGHTLYQELIRIPLIIKLPRQKHGEIREQLFSISDVAGLIQAECGLEVGERNFTCSKINNPQRILELSLPVIPASMGLFGRVSFIRNDHQYIHNFLPAAATWNEFSPKPVICGDEWFTLGNIPIVAAQLFSPSSALRSRCKKSLVDYLRRLKTLKKNDRQFDSELMKKLKALGYLNN